MCTAHGVATSANKIANAAVFYLYPASSTLHDSEGGNVFVVCTCQEKGVVVACSFGFSYVLQFAKHLFSVSVPQLTKYLVMRECENILDGYLYVVTTVFNQQQGISIFKSPKRVFEISCRDLTLSLFFSLV